MLMFRGIGDLGDDHFGPTPPNTPVPDTEDEMEDSSEDELSPRRASRPTRKNPFNGLVEGVKRGNVRYGECHSRSVSIIFFSWSH